MVARWLLPAALLGAFLSGCHDDTSPVTKDPVVEPASGVIGQKYLFDRFIIGYSWGYQLSGTYVDSLGYVVAYRYDAPVWTPDDFHGLAPADLDTKYGGDLDTLAVLPRDVLLQKSALIGPASLGPVTMVDPGGADGATLVSACYRYEATSDRYDLVVLRALNTGQVVQVNEAPEATALAAWLDSLVAAVQP